MHLSRIKLLCVSWSLIAFQSPASKVQPETYLTLAYFVQLLWLSFNLGNPQGKIVTRKTSPLRTPHLELSLQPIDQNLQVQLSHALNDRLVGLLITREVERGVLLRQLDQPRRHLVQVGLRLGLNGNLRRKLHKVSDA